MLAEEFKEQNVILGKDQQEYHPLPAFWNKRDKSYTFCFSLNKEEIDEVVRTGKIWFKQVTFGKPLNPVALSTQKEDLIQNNNEVGG